MKKLLRYLCLLGILLLIPNGVFASEAPLCIYMDTPVTTGNIFTDGMEQRIPLIIENKSGTVYSATVNYTAVSRGGVSLLNKSENITFTVGQKKKVNVNVDMDFYDTAVLTVSVVKDGTTVVSEKFDFSHTKTAKTQNPDYGINSHDLRGPRGDMTYKIDLFANAGFGFLRDSVEWHRTEDAVKGELSLLDGHVSYIDTLKKRNIDTLFILGLGNHHYDDKGAPYSEEGQTAFASYGKFISDQFSPYGAKYYEVWNEWDLEGNASFNPASQPASVYRELLKKTSAAITQEDAQIVAPGLAEIDELTWIEEVFKDGGYDAFDIFSVHPYRHDRIPEEANLATKVKLVRDLMKQYGEEKPIWFTERGYYMIGSEEKGATTPEEHAAWAVRQYLYIKGNDLADKVFWYNAWDKGTDTTYTEHNYGLTKAESDVNVPLAAKPAYLAIANMHSFINEGEFVSLARPNTTTYVSEYKYANDNKLFVAWTTGAAGTITQNYVGKYKIYDMYGNLTKTINSEGGTVTIDVSGEPVYIEILKNDIKEEVAIENVVVDGSKATISGLCQPDSRLTVAVFKQNYNFENVNNIAASRTLYHISTVQTDDSGNFEFDFKIIGDEGYYTLMIGSDKTTKATVKTVYMGEGEAVQLLLEKNGSEVTDFSQIAQGDELNLFVKYFGAEPTVEMIVSLTYSDDHKEFIIKKGFEDSKLDNLEIPLDKSRNISNISAFVWNNFNELKPLIEKFEIKGE